MGKGTSSELTLEIRRYAIAARLRDKIKRAKAADVARAIKRKEWIAGLQVELDKAEKDQSDTPTPTE